MHSSIGRTATDKITGFKGVVTGRCEYLTGCNQILLAPKSGDDGSLKESHWFDEQRCDFDDDAERVVLNNGNTPGFDKAAPKR